MLHGLDRVIFDVATSSVDEAQTMIYTDIDMRVQASKALRSTPRYREGSSAVVTYLVLPKLSYRTFPYPCFTPKVSVQPTWQNCSATSREGVKFLLKNHEARG